MPRLFLRQIVSCQRNQSCKACRYYAITTLLLPGHPAIDCKCPGSMKRAMCSVVWCSYNLSYFLFWFVVFRRQLFVSDETAHNEFISSRFVKCELLIFARDAKHRICRRALSVCLSVRP